jgi:cytochrome oxidase Cu insertion factor (SCO1/SenC/PrrC family)
MTKRPHQIIANEKGRRRERSHMARDISEGASAPDFTLPSDQGGDIRLKDLKGKKVVLYFYPKDNTSG